MALTAGSERLVEPHLGLAAFQKRQLELRHLGRRFTSSIFVAVDVDEQ